MSSDEDHQRKGNIYNVISVDSNMADNFIYFLSAVSDYCMVCFFRKVFLKSDTAVALRGISIFPCLTIVFIDIYNEYFCKMMWLSAISLDVFGTCERTCERNVPMYTEIVFT